jgi:hypothetical protein
MAQPAERLAELDSKQPRNRRGGTFPPEFKDAAKLLDKLAVDLPLARTDLNKIGRKIAQGLETLRRAEDERQRDDDWERTWLHMRYNGRLLADIRGLEEKDGDGNPIADHIRAKEQFRRRGWKV